MPREDAFSDVPYAARKYLAEVERKRQAMNRRSPGSGDEYVKGQIRAAKGSPKRITSKPTSKSVSKSVSKPAKKVTKSSVKKSGKSKYEINMDKLLGR